MELDWEQKRLLMLYEYKLGTKAAEAARRINQACGAGTVGESTVYERFREFKAGNEDLTDKPRLGRPQEIDRQAVINRIEEEPSMTSTMLAEEFDCTHPTILTILHEAGKKCLKSKWVPYDLTMDQQTKRFDACIRLFERYRRGTLNLEHVVTCNERWAAFDNPDRQ
ncbi:MAG: hypothetical protein DI539_31720, partial [Flavobacterium psychrophilum]